MSSLGKKADKHDEQGLSPLCTDKSNTAIYWFITWYLRFLTHKFSNSQLTTPNFCTYEENSYLADGSAHPSSSIMVQVSLVSHREAQKLHQSSCCWICFKNFLSKQMYLYLPAWKLSLHHFHELADSEETARQSICENYGCRRQQAAGDNSCIMTFSHFWPPGPACVLLLLWSNITGPSRHQASAWVVC